MFLGPCLHDGSHLGVAGEALFHAFGQHVVQLGVERIHVRNGWRRRRLILEMRFQHQRKAEVVGSRGHVLCSLECAFAYSRNCQSGGQGKCLLHPGQYIIDPPRIGFDGGSSHAAHCVHQQEHIRILSYDFGNFLERIHQPGGSFVVDKRDCVILPRCQLLIHHLRLHGNVPGDLKRIARHPVSSRNLVPTLGKGAVDQIQAAFGHQIGHGRFHCPR